MSRLARIWPFRRPADPSAVREFRIKGRPEVHRVEAGTPLADARERGAIVLFETDDPQRFMLGEARDGAGKLVAVIAGWTSYSLGHVVGTDGTVRDKRRAAAWGWPVEADGAPALESERAKPVPQGEPEVHGWRP